MEEFKYRRNKENFIWQNKRIKIVFSNPSMQSIDECIYAKSIEDILYLYYNMTIYIKEDSKWIKKNNVYTYDFPKIIALKKILNIMLNHKYTKEECQLNEYEPNNKMYSYTLSTDSFLCDDTFRLTRYDLYDDNELDSTSYTLYCGCSISNCGDINTIGINMINLSDDEIKNLETCVNEFLAYVIEKNNKTVRNRILSNKFKIQYNKLYKYNNSEIKSFYVINDICDIEVLNGSIDDINLQTNTYNNVRIIDLQDDKIFIEYESKTIVINTDKICFIDRDIPDVYLYYTEQNIESDFLLLLSEEEKEYLKKIDQDKFYEIYQNALIERYWMYRDEHKFYRYKKKDTENVKYIVKHILKNIKTNL